MSVRRINTNISGTGQMNTMNNPIIKESVSSGGEFITRDGELYSPGNSLYDMYSGNYHIHRSGHVCAGSHNRNVMQSNRFLVELPKNQSNKNRILNSLNISTDDE